jgi:hypothetical protein
MKTESYYRVIVIIAFFVLSFLSVAVTAKSQNREVPSTDTELVEDGTSFLQ